MRQKEILLNIQPLNPPDDDADDGHMLTSFETPMRKDAFELDDEVKIERIEKHFREIMTILGLDLTEATHMWFASTTTPTSGVCRTRSISFPI